MNLAKDIIGKSIRTVLLTAAIIVGMSGPVVAMDAADIVMHFFGGSTPAGTVYLTDSDGARLTDSDGAYLTQ